MTRVDARRPANGVATQIDGREYDLDPPRAGAACTLRR